MKCFIGWDSREISAFNACINSINTHSSSEIDFQTLKRQELIQKGYSRQDESGSTEFTYTRFLVPHLCEYKGWAAFFDCDFIFTADINELFALKDDKYAIMCVKHDYVPKQKTKMDNQKQVNYPRKNWSSLILWNCGHPSNKKLTLETVNCEKPSYLHRFQWLKDEEIGELPITWNWLEGEYDKLKTTPNAIHFTNGGPWFENCQDVDYADLWFNYNQS